MPRGPKDDRPASVQVAWVKHLPKEGGDWGRGVTQTVASTEADLQQLQTQYEKMVADHKAQESALHDTIRNRQRLLAETVKRANSEVSMLYAGAQVEQAQAAADRAERRAQRDVPAADSAAGE